jgi:hypothetical protein
MISSQLESPKYFYVHSLQQSLKYFKLFELFDSVHSSATTVLQLPFLLISHKTSSTCALLAWLPVLLLHFFGNENNGISLELSEINSESLSTHSLKMISLHSLQELLT